MKNLKELTLEESKQLQGGYGLFDPYHGLPPNYNRNIIRKSNFKKGIRLTNWILYSK
ncbi:MAG: hypothetical protein AB8B59_05870 [Maribacter sp.]